MPGRLLPIALLLGLMACGNDDRNPIERARDSLKDAIARRDVTELGKVRARLQDARPETPEELAEIATLMMRAGETAQALWLLEAGISRYPEREELRLLLARAALIVGDPIRALAALESTPADSDRYLSALMLRARAQLDLGNLDGALAIFAEAEQRDPDSPEAFYARIFTLLREGRVEEARSAIEQARHGAQTIERRRELDALIAQIEFAQGDRAAGLARMRSLVEETPEDVSALQLLVRSLQADGQLEEALAVAQAGLSRGPDHPTRQALVAWALALLGRQDEAERALRRLVDTSDSPNAHLLLARFLLFTDQPHAAAEDLREAANRHPDAPMLRMHEAEAWIDCADLERARAALAQFQSGAAEDPHAGYLEGRIALAEGDAKKATVRLGEVVPNLDRAYTQYWLGRALEAAGDLMGAQRRYGLAMLRDSSHPAPAIALMRLAERRRDWRAAAEYAAQLIARYPAGYEGYANLVTFLARAGDGERAETAARIYLKRFPTREDAPVLLAISLRIQGRFSEAQAALEAAAAVQGLTPAIVHERALIFGARGDAAEGIRAARDAIAMRPDEPRYYATLAALAFSTGDVETGNTAVDTAVAIGHGFLEPLKLRARYRAASQDFAGARQDIELYLADEPDDPEAHFMRGVISENEGHKTDAVSDYRRAIELDEASFAPYNNLAMLLVDLGEVDEAVRMANRAYARAGTNAKVVETLGWVYLHAGRSNRAVKLLERALELNPDSTETQQHLAAARSALAEEKHTNASRKTSDPPGLPDSVLRRRGSDARRPNVALIVVDTLRPDWTTPYGDMRGATPELARWAAHGVLFEAVRAQSSWTKVSVASMMTSLWPADHGVREIRDALGDAANTLAEQFQQAGYATYAVQSNGWLAASFGFQQGFDHYVFPRGANVAWMKSMVWPHADNVYLEAERLLDAHDSRTPFFLYLHFMDVHEYAAPTEFQNFGTDNAGAYMAAIRWIDHVLERLRKKLAAMEQLDDTLLVLASDHGETFGEDRRWGHARNARSPVLRVPLVIRLPDATGPLRVSDPVRNLDLAPTLLDWAGIAIPDSFEGESLLPLLRKSERRLARDRTSFASLPALLFRDAILQESVSRGGWSLVRDIQDPEREQLFDLTIDPDEEVDLIEIEPDAAQPVRSLLDTYEQRTPLSGVVTPGVHIDPQIADRLRALGYLQ